MATTKEADDRQEYVVSINNIPHTMLLDDNHATYYGEAAEPAGTPTPQQHKAGQAQAKVHAPQNKGA